MNIVIRRFFFYYPKNKQGPIYSLDIEDMEGSDEDETDRQLNLLDSIFRSYGKNLKEISRNLGLI